MIWDKALHWSGIYHIGWAGWPISPRNWPASTCSAMGLQVLAAVSTFYTWVHLLLHARQTLYQMVHLLSLLCSLHGWLNRENFWALGWSQEDWDTTKSFDPDYVEGQREQQICGWKNKVTTGDEKQFFRISIRTVSVTPWDVTKIQNEGVVDISTVIEIKWVTSGWLNKTELR